MAHATHVHPARITIHSTELATDVRRGIGFSADCACGWRSERLYRSHREAREAAAAHNRACREEVV